MAGVWPVGSQTQKKRRNLDNFQNKTPRPPNAMLFFKNVFLMRFYICQHLNRAWERSSRTSTGFTDKQDEKLNRFNNFKKKEDYKQLFKIAVFQLSMGHNYTTLGNTQGKRQAWKCIVGQIKPLAYPQSSWQFFHLRSSAKAWDALWKTYLTNFI